MKYTIRISRFHPDSPEERRFSEFELDAEEGMTVLDALIWLKENKDGSLAFRYSCRMGVCGSCGMLINGYPMLACHTQLAELNAAVVTVEPLPNHDTIRDLVPELSPMFEKHRGVKPHIERGEPDVAPKAELAQSQEEHGSYAQFSYCIKCGICVSACPTCATDSDYTGPQALAQAHRYSQDSRDNGAAARMAAVDKEHGIFNCHYAGACSEACPKGVDPALAIQLFKKRMAADAWGLGEAQKPSAEIPQQGKNLKPNIPPAPARTV
ncbi:MAG: succinate dehydrogenase iron-sulfur subunit [Elusimicrobiota bacterium]